MLGRVFPPIQCLLSIGASYQFSPLFLVGSSSIQLIPSRATPSSSIAPSKKPAPPLTAPTIRNFSTRPCKSTLPLCARHQANPTTPTLTAVDVLVVVAAVVTLGMGVLAKVVRGARIAVLGVGGVGVGVRGLGGMIGIDTEGNCGGCLNLKRRPLF